MRSSEHGFSVTLWACYGTLCCWWWLFEEDAQCSSTKSLPLHVNAANTFLHFAAMPSTDTPLLNSSQHDIGLAADVVT
jgi:hypothetical protein